MYLEPKYPRDVGRRGRWGHEVPVGLQEEVAEGGAKVGAIHVGLALRARVVDVLLAVGAGARELTGAEGGGADLGGRGGVRGGRAEAGGRRRGRAARVARAPSTWRRRPCSCASAARRSAPPAARADPGRRRAGSGRSACSCTCKRVGAKVLSLGAAFGGLAGGFEGAGAAAQEEGEHPDPKL